MKMNEIQLARILDQARSLVEEEKYLHAAQVYLRLTLAEPAFIVPYLELSSVYADLGRLEAAIRLLERALEVAPDTQELLFTLGNLHLRGEEYEQALRYYKLLSGRKLPQVHYQMGVAYFYQNKFPYPEEQFRLTLKFDPHYPRINESLGELLIRRESYADAIETLKRAIVANPYSPVSHHLLGIAHLRTDDWKHAHQEFVLALDMDPQEPLNWQLCGETLMHLRQYAEAEPYLRKSLELNGGSVETLVALAKVHLTRGEAVHARDCLDRAMRIDPVTARICETRWRLKSALRQQSHQS